MAKRYTDEQLEAIQQLMFDFGHLYYHMGSDLENRYNLLTGDIRCSGALYMVAWRMEKGYYEHRGFVA